MAGVGRRRGVGERWYPDDIWKRHRQTYREEARLALPTRTSRFVTFGFASRRRPFLLFRAEITEHPLCADRSSLDLSVFQIIGSTDFDRESRIEIRGSGSPFLRERLNTGRETHRLVAKIFPKRIPRHICGLADILRTRVRAGAWRSLSRVNYRYRRTKISLRPKFNHRPDLRDVFKYDTWFYTLRRRTAEERMDKWRIGFKLFGRGGKKDGNGREMNTHGVSEARRFGACDALE